MRLALSVAAISVLCGPSFAQDWDVSAAIYGWGPDTSATVDTPFGPVTGELSFSDAWEALDFAFMGTITADRGRLGLIADTVFLDLSDDRGVEALPAVNSVAVDSRIGITSLYATWQIASNASGRFDLGAGVRFYTTDSDIAVDSIAEPMDFSIGDDWVDPLIAVRYRTDLGQNWYATLFADVGGFGVGSEQSWQALALVGYRVTDRFSVEAGYRMLQSDRIAANGSIDVEMSGPAIGLRWQF